MRIMSYAREIRSSLSWDGTFDIQGSAKCMSGVLKGNGTAMRISKAEIKMETLKLRMYSREIRDRMQLIRQCRVVTTHEYVVSGDGTEPLEFCIIDSRIVT